ncbi:hypothetical protein PsorP6_008313 [Peronosclerospora sorghi]|uniref:Uncharacterized protein n=1 Tax=Peronosclerospora sorghi TaxID=230839 RepID=A0ACC0W887_9STRA|nr:hypothetical protein PsorP6_008313 [Peronosclerospora sorghi]
MTTKSPLLDWVAKHESVVSVAQDLIDPESIVAKYGKDDSSIVARSAIQPGSILVTLKTGAFLNGSYWLNRSNIELQEHFDTLQLNGTMKTTLALLAELAQVGTKNLEICFDQQHRKRKRWLQVFEDGINLIMWCLGFPILDDDFVLKMHSNYVGPLAKKFPTIWPSEVSTLGKFQWAYSIVSSRLYRNTAFGVNDLSEPTLFPVIDMANHDTDNPAAHILKTGSGSFQVHDFFGSYAYLEVVVDLWDVEQLTALREVKKGEPVTISYGDLSNAQVLKTNLCTQLSR